jgi:sodium/potassium/calcium exchanger 6
VVAWGVSLGDMVADIAIARSGQPKMAVSACYAGPVLNTLIGLGIGITGYLFFAPYFLISISKTLILSFVVLIIANLATLIVVPLCRFKSPRLHGVFLATLYLGFMIFGILVELEFIWVS